MIKRWLRRWLGVPTVYDVKQLEGYCFAMKLHLDEHLKEPHQVGNLLDHIADIEGMLQEVKAMRRDG